MVEYILNNIVMLGRFFSYLFAAFVLVILFAIVYAQVTPVRELERIRAGNTSAAVTLSGAVLGFILPLASIAAYTAELPDLFFWGIVALVVQLIVHFLIRIVIRDWSKAIENDVLSVAILSACMALAAGLINAACMVL